MKCGYVIYWYIIYDPTYINLIFQEFEELSGQDKRFTSEFICIFRLLVVMKNIILHGNGHHHMHNFGPLQLIGQENTLKWNGQAVLDVIMDYLTKSLFDRLQLQQSWMANFVEKLKCALKEVYVKKKQSLK